MLKSHFCHLDTMKGFTEQRFTSFYFSFAMLFLCVLSRAVGQSRPHERLFLWLSQELDWTYLFRGGCAEAVMLTDSDCEIEHTVSALTQHFLCGKGSPQTERSSPGTAQP